MAIGLWVTLAALGGCRGAAGALRGIAAAARAVHTVAVLAHAVASGYAHAAARDAQIAAHVAYEPADVLHEAVPECRVGEALACLPIPAPSSAPPPIGVRELPSCAAILHPATDAGSCQRRVPNLHDDAEVCAYFCLEHCAIHVPVSAPPPANPPPALVLMCPEGLAPACVVAP
jgi:hypothetical protein